MNGLTAAISHISVQSQLGLSFLDPVITKLEPVPDPYLGADTPEEKMDLWLNYGERDIDPWYGVDKGNDKEVKKRQDELDDAEW